MTEVPFGLIDGPRLQLHFFTYEYSNLAKQTETYQTVALGLSNRTVTLAYDGADRLTSESTLVGGANITSNYTYDAGGQRGSGCPLFP